MPRPKDGLLDLVTTDDGPSIAFDESPLSSCIFDTRVVLAVKQSHDLLFDLPILRLWLVPPTALRTVLYFGLSLLL